MGKHVQCPVCGREVPTNAINSHLDSGCQNSIPSTSKLAPLFTSQLGKRGTETRPKAARSARGSSPEIVVIDDEKSTEEPFAKRTKVENVAPIFAKPSVQQSTSSDSALIASAPLAERLRPRRLGDFVGQEHLIGDGSLLLSLVESRAIGSMILWGPPGCGKTTLARLLSTTVDANFKELSATSSGIADVKSIFDAAKRTLKLTGKRTILFMDEIQRFNKAQQDIFLPYVENGWITLIGATTENPSFKLNGALLSRCRVFVLERLSDAEITIILTRAIQRASRSDVGQTAGEPASSPTAPESRQENGAEVTKSPDSKGVDKGLRPISNEVMKTIVNLSTGDARTALSLLELVLTSPSKATDASIIAHLRRSVSSRYDRSGEDRYDMISALHKSIRGSSGDGALYWLARMLTVGEDPLYIARRLIVVASEDVGLADHRALSLAVSAYSAVQMIGMPEARITLAHLVAYLAEAPKSTRSYEAYQRAEEAAKMDETAPVPMHLRNAPTKMMKEMKYGQGYLYNPSYRHPVHQEYLPAGLGGQKILLGEGDLTGKVWDEDALRTWEWRNGHDWPGRRQENVATEGDQKGQDL